MSSIDPSRTSRSEALRSDHARPAYRQSDGSRGRGEDAYAGSGGGKHSGGETERDHHSGDLSRGAGQNLDNQSDTAALLGQGEPQALDESGQQAELAHRSDAFRRSLKAAMADMSQSTGPRREGSNSSDDGIDRHGGRVQPNDEYDGAQSTDNLSGFGHLFTRQAETFSHSNKQDAMVGEATQGDDEFVADRMVLAASSAAVESTLPLFSTLQSPVEPATSGRGQEIAGAIEERVAQALNARNSAQSGGAATISLDLGGLIEGLAAITIRMSATGLDVILTGSLDLGSEAQALADRLSRRFAHRNVRIFTAPACEDVRSSDQDGSDGELRANTTVTRARSADDTA